MNASVSASASSGMQRGSAPDGVKLRIYQSVSDRPSTKSSSAKQLLSGSACSGNRSAPSAAEMRQMLQRKPEAVSLRTALLTQVKTAPSVCMEKSSSVSGYTHSRRPLSSSHRKTLDCCAVPPL